MWQTRLQQLAGSCCHHSRIDCASGQDTCVVKPVPAGPTEAPHVPCVLKTAHGHSPRERDPGTWSGVCGVRDARYGLIGGAAGDCFNHLWREMHAVCARVLWQGSSSTASAAATLDGPLYLHKGC